ncbi:TetR/AcrR family transcriptional regulator [Nocardiopsis aegyptia]|uniref:TetR/AcrR family transcriptional regulator n=1 Tax=Nocardiopsis aegyptia TaxID=220378 RepID=UPI003670FC09
MTPEPPRPTDASQPRGGAPARRRRSDARRNVDALLESAKEVFASSGVDAPAKEITDRAGVGVGTLYRHFPRRSDLIIAVLQHEIDKCAQAAEDLGRRLGPWEALLAWVERFTEFVGTKRGLATALHSGDPAYDGLPQRLLDGLEPPLRTLLTRAVREGCARDDVGARDILTTVALLCRPVPDERPDFNRDMARVFMDGMRRVGDSPVQVSGEDESAERWAPASERS